MNVVRHNSFVPFFVFPTFLEGLSFLSDGLTDGLSSVCLCLADMLVSSNAVFTSVYKVLVLITSFIFILHLAGIVIE